MAISAIITAKPDNDLTISPKGIPAKALRGAIIIVRPVAITTKPAPDDSMLLPEVSFANIAISPSIAAMTLSPLIRLLVSMSLILSTALIIINREVATPKIPNAVPGPNLVLDAILANIASSRSIAPMADIDLTNCAGSYSVKGSSAFTKISIDKATPIKALVFTPLRLNLDMIFATVTNSAITTPIAVTAGTNRPGSIPLRIRKDIASSNIEDATASILGMLASDCLNLPPAIPDSILVAITISPRPKPNAVSPLAS